MKTFGQLKPGDTIYYYDHGDIHAQIVHSVDTTPEIHEFTDWQGHEQQNKLNRVVIEAGKGTVLKLYWNSCSSYVRANYMPRFSDFEAVKNWITQNYLRASRYRTKYLRKLSNANKALETYKKLLNFVDPNNEQVLS